jgi:hypothetical protein
MLGSISVNSRSNDGIHTYTFATVYHTSNHLKQASKVASSSILFTFLLNF